MQAEITSSPHVHGPDNVSRVMLRVVYALVPAILAYIWLFGWGVLSNLFVAIIVALGAEAAMLALRRRPIKVFLLDGSALVTAVLLGLALPPLSPIWLVAVGTAFAIIFAKHLYGGLGYNPFNPAMVGYVVLLISFPLEMTTWLPPGELQGQSLSLLQTLSYAWGGQLPAGISLDTLSMATPLDHLKTQLGQAHSVSTITASSPLYGMLGGRGWEITNALILAGGLWLLYKRVITWHVPLASLASLFAIALLFHLIDADRYAGPLFHLFSGGAILGAFFIATDPVSGATSPRGQIVFGIGVGTLEYVIRTWGGYPDGVAFSVLLMNMAAPTIDYYTQPQVFGHKGS